MAHSMLFHLFLFAAAIGFAAGGHFHWLPDRVAVSSSQSVAGSSARLNVTVTSNGALFRDAASKGHFRIQFSFVYKQALQLRGETQCVSFTESAAQAERLLSQSLVSASAASENGQHLSSYFNVVARKYVRFDSAASHSSSLLFSAAPLVRNVSALSFQISLDRCSALRTISDWEDKARWREGGVPSASDDVTIPLGAGVIQLSADVSMRTLNMSSGTIRAQTSGCPYDWTTADSKSSRDKCYRLVDDVMTFSDASSFCKRTIGAGSNKRNLVKIADRNELDVVLGLCRAQSRRACWIGLFDRSGMKRFEWLVDDEVKESHSLPLFLDWRRTEPNNHTLSEGKEAEGGERCVATVPLSEDPLIEEQGSWNDFYCQNKLPFVCQSTATTERHTISVFNLIASGGSIEGGIVSLGNSSRIVMSTFSNGVRLVVPQIAKAFVQHLEMENGVRLDVNGSLILRNGAFVDKNPLSAQNLINLGSSSRLQVHGNVSVHARVISSGEISISPMSALYLRQGGLLSQAALTVAAADSSLVLAGYASRLATFDSFELQLTNRGPFVGEYHGANVSAELKNKHNQETKGVYRLMISSNSSSFQTRCVPFNASAEHLTAALNDIPLVRNRGGVTIRRYGDESLKIYGFGLTYRIQIDAAQTSTLTQGPLSLSVLCQGFDCGCSESKVSIVSPSGEPACPNPSQYSLVDSDSCVLRPIITMQRISTLSSIRTQGLGYLEVVDGVHRLMPLSNIAVHVRSGLGIVSADTMTWLSVEIAKKGFLRLTGTSWKSWDSQFFMFRPSWEDRRGFLSVNNASAFNMTCQRLTLSDDAELQCIGTGSRLFFSEGSWRGGVLGGLCDTYISKQIDLAGNLKSLRNGMTLQVESGAQAIWNEGNISLANGARMLVRGLLNINNINDDKITIGEAHLLTSAQSTWEPGRSWQSYFDKDLSSELRPAWYNNPLCGDKCSSVNELKIEGSGLLKSGQNSSVLFLLPLKIEGLSRFDVGQNAKVYLGSGGVFGNDVIVDLASGTLLELSGGEMLMEALCTIRGAGELIVSAGSHTMGFSVDAHITISGGTLLWPESRGTQKTITFNGGLLIKGTGKLEVQPFSTTIIVHKEVQLSEQSMIQFPLIGIAAQASPFDRSDAPDSSPRGNLTATSTMRWDGGTLMGKADFYALRELFLDGDVKYIKSLAKLVNKGHCEWGNGNLIASDNGDFQNFGTVQMKNGADNFFSEAMYKGSEMPVENGGDFFALEYHSWDSDYGSLDYSEYLRLRTIFVSKVPLGWTFESQDKNQT